ncbi:M42 family metallopeptidase [Desulfoferrobacter suflitae]|uniref:M42 family metallopeptidase n=1 Tax=Desulfoferrobacter suflitae TaxID=2865782 RepID=UPI002164ECFF|nr:M42 family metallopeptidase [Desulfoferrobacter suflitae]MCK8601703.1 M42 family metallopeptidase [Desulfoferrobacter suflitae]
MDSTERLLRELSETHGVPGHETEIRAVVRRHLQDSGRFDHDRIGSLVCRTGQAGPRVMIAAHMDEIGFMVKLITEEGCLRFLPLGGWWDQVLLGQRVVIKTHQGDLPGVIGAKPPHVLPQEERKKVIELKDMYIDVGFTSKAQAEEAGVRPGDPVVPDAHFQVTINNKVYMGKAFDDRVGLALLIDAVKHFSSASHPNILYGVGTVMEEVGLRGAKTSASLVDPDAAIILEADICGDVPGIKPEESNVKLGGGPSLVLLEARMIPNVKFRDLVMDVARLLDIPLQFSAGLGGSTDGGQIHLHGCGVPTIVLGVPTRHIHSHVGIMHRDDYDRTLQLLIALIERLDETVVQGFSQ